tara:strand:+ start:563 stop:1243 length:681 start_codon:yes stop_codon:yes gene_type:complete
MSKTIPLPLREAVWRKDYGNKLDGKCWVCDQNTISALNFECGHIQSRKRGGAAELNNLKAICGPCNKSMGTRDMNHYRTHIWRGRKLPDKKQSSEIRNKTFNLVVNNNTPTVVKIMPPGVIKFDSFVTNNRSQKKLHVDIISTYTTLGSFMKPRAQMSDVSMWYECYICWLDQMMENPNVACESGCYQCLDKFCQTKTWYDTASGYERGKYTELLNKFRKLRELIK